MSAKRDYYEVLGVQKGASQEEIKKLLDPGVISRFRRDETYLFYLVRCEDFFKSLHDDTDIPEPHLSETARQGAVTAVPGTASLEFDEESLPEGTSRREPGAGHRIFSVKRLIVCDASSD